MNGKNVNHIGDGLSEREKAEELNMLSYLCRKYPEEALNHIPFKHIEEFWWEKWLRLREHWHKRNARRDGGIECGKNTSI